jgi:lysophospholipase L1-like esterase
MKIQNPKAARRAPQVLAQVFAGAFLGLLPFAALAQEGDAVANVDAAKSAPFRWKVKGNEVLEKQGALLDGFSANAWDGKSSGEVWLEEAPVEGSKAVGLANTEGQAALQLYNWRPYELSGGRTYTFSAQYLTRGAGAGKLTLEGVEGAAFNIESTKGQWKSIQSTFEQKEAAKVTTKLQIYSMGLDNAVFLRSLKIMDAGPIGPQKPTRSIAYNDPAIKYVGRWQDKNGAMEGFWVGGTLKVGFTGTTIQVKLRDAATVVARIDDGPEATFEKAKGTVNLTPVPLAEGSHTLRLYASTGAPMKVTGLLVDENASVRAASALPRLIEFVGDSITDGMGTANYSVLVSDRLGTEHTRIATGAMYLADGKNHNATWMDIRTGIATQYFKTGNIYQSQEPWDFKKYIADAVVINLGQNDHGGEISDAFFTESYVKMMEKIRQNYPDTTILALRPFGGARMAATQNAVKARNEAGDGKVFFVDTTGWIAREDTNDGIHPTVDGNRKIADRLAPLLERVLKGQSPQ